MRLNLVLLISMTVIWSRGKTNSRAFDKLKRFLPKQPPQDCLLELEKRFSNFQYCNITHNKTIEYLEEALPYVCLLTLNMVIESCENRIVFNELKQFNETKFNKTVCPFNYGERKKHLNIELDEGAKYFLSNESCHFVCNFNKNLKSNCELMVYVSERLNKHINTTRSNETTDGDTHETPPKPVIVQSKKVVPSRVNDAPALLGEKAKKANTQPIADNEETKKDFNAHSNDNSNNKPSANAEKTEGPVMNDKDVNEDKLTALHDNPESTPFAVSNEHDYNSQFLKKNQYDLDKNINPEDEDNMEDLSHILPKLPNGDSNIQSLDTKKFYSDSFIQAEDSHFSVYFLMTVSVIIIGYIIYHNKNKIVAYALEGKRTRNGRRRPTSASYRKLDCNLEEAIASNPSHASVTNVVY